MSLKEIFKHTLPVMFGYIPLGMAYAILGVSLEIPAWFIALASVIVYAGSGQFLLVGLIGMGSNLLSIFIATFLLNLRHMFYAISLLSDISALKKGKIYAIFGLTDESFAVLKGMSIEPKNRDKIYFFVIFFNQIYWVLGTILGILVGKNLKVNYSGIEFSLTALFVVLAIELFKNNANFKVLFLGILIGILGLIFVPQNYTLLVCLCIGIVLLFIFRKWI